MNNSINIGEKISEEENAGPILNNIEYFQQKKRVSELTLKCHHTNGTARCAKNAKSYDAGSHPNSSLAAATAYR